MGAEIIPITAGRPSLVEVSGCRIYISVRDEYHRRELRRWKARLAEAHPDRINALPYRVKSRSTEGRIFLVFRQGRSLDRGAKFRSVQRAFERWLEEEKRWYEQFNLEPPRW